MSNSLQPMINFIFYAKEFISKIVRIRLYLIRTGKSKKNLPDFARECENLNYFADLYKSEKQLAELIIINNNFILKIIPSSGSKMHTRLMDEFNKIYEAASIIINS